MRALWTREGARARPYSGPALRAIALGVAGVVAPAATAWIFACVAVLLAGRHWACSADHVVALRGALFFAIALGLVVGSGVVALLAGVRVASSVVRALAFAGVATVGVALSPVTQAESVTAAGTAWLVAVALAAVAIVRAGRVAPC